MVAALVDGASFNKQGSTCREVSAPQPKGRAPTRRGTLVAELEATIRGVLGAHGHLAVAASQLREDDDLYQRGLSSHASVNLMLALEDAFDVEFPDSLLRRDTFRSIRTIEAALESLGVGVGTG